LGVFVGHRDTVDQANVNHADDADRSRTFQPNSRARRLAEDVPCANRNSRRESHAISSRLIVGVVIEST